MTLITDPTQTFTIGINHEGKAYTLKLKVNPLNAKKSTAKLTDENQKTHLIAKDNIHWQNLDTTPPKKLFKEIIKIASSISLKPTNDPHAPFEIYMGAIKSTQKFSQGSIVSVQNSKDFIRLLKEQSSSLIDLIKQMVDYFCETPVLSRLDVEELMAVSELLSNEEQGRITKRVVESDSLELMITAFKALEAGQFLIEKKYLFMKIQNNFHLSENELGSLLKYRDQADNKNAVELSPIFQKTLREKYPLILCLRSQLQSLMSDQKFVEERRHSLGLKALSPKEVEPRPIKELIDDMISKGKKSILISANGGTEKTLFIKSYVQDLLENYQLQEPFPFYLSLESIDNPQGNLMRDSLKLFNLEPFEKELKKCRTLWFFDDSDKVFRKNKSPFKIYDLNRLVEWQNAQFIFTCDAEQFGAGEVERYFAPVGKSLENLNIVANSVHSEGQINIFLVKTIEDYGQLFAHYRSKSDLFFDSTHISHQFTVISPWENSDTAEMIALLEFLNQENQEKTISKFIGTFSSLKTTVAATELLIATKNPEYRSLAKPLLIAASETFAGRSVILEDDLEHVIRIFDHLLPEHQNVFFNKLIAAVHTISAKNLVENLTEAFKVLLRINYRVAAQRRSDPTLIPPLALLDTPTASTIKALIFNQIGKLESYKLGSYLDHQNVPLVSCYLTCLTILMEIAFALNLKLFQTKEYKIIHNFLNHFTDKNFSKRFKPHSETCKTDFGIEFLAKYAMYLLQMIGDDENPNYKDLRRVFYTLRGLATVAAVVSIDQPWQILRGIFDSVDDFQKALTGRAKKLTAFTHLNLLQSAYLGGNPESLKDFEAFAKALLDTSSTLLNIPKHLSVHNQRYFVIGFLKLLSMIHQCYAKEAPEIGQNAIALIRLIKTNNSKFTVNMLFSLEPEKVNSDIRDFVFNEASRMLNKINNPVVSCNPSIQETNRLFPLVFNQKFFWLESLRRQLQDLNDDKNFREDKPYVVDLKGNFRGVDGKLEDHLHTVLRSKKLVLIMGDPGSGKTLFLKQYIQQLINNYQPGDPIPFYFSLGSVRHSKGNLIGLILKEYGLEEYEKGLQNLPTVWFLDAFDEMFLGTNENPSNIYVDNEFKNWPKAQFVFTCRANMLRAGDEQRYFSPPGMAPELLSVAPFGPNEIELFFKKYIAVKTSSGQSVWDLERYELYIKKLGLKTIIQTPYYLRQIADYIPALETMLDSLTSDDRIKKNEKGEKKFFLDLLVSLNIKREACKTACDGIPIRKPSEYLEFALKVCWLMHLCQLKIVPKRILGSETEIERARARADYNLEVSEKREMLEEAFFKQQYETAVKEQKEGRVDEITNKLVQCRNNLAKIAQDRLKLRVIKTADDELQQLLYGESMKHLRTEALIKNTPQGIEFAHPVLFDYFLEVNGNQQRKKQLIKSID